VSIYADITNAITDFDNGNYEKFGEDVGSAAALVFFGKPNSTAMSQDMASSYSMISGLGEGLTSKDLSSSDSQTLYNNASVYSTPLFDGVNAIFNRSIISPKNIQTMIVDLGKLLFTAEQ